MSDHFDYGEKRKDGQYERHPSLPEEKPVLREIKRTYQHLKCGGVTRMPESCARTYAQDPKYYSSTFCCSCSGYFSVSEFVWDDNKKPINE